MVMYSIEWKHNDKQLQCNKDQVGRSYEVMKLWSQTDHTFTLWRQKIKQACNGFTMSNSKKKEVKMKPVTCWRQWCVGPVPVAVTNVHLVGAARYLNLRTHSPGHPVLNTQFRTPSPHRILLELRSLSPRPITLVSLQGRLPNLHNLHSLAIHNVSWMLWTRRLTVWRIHSPQV